MPENWLKWGISISMKPFLLTGLLFQQLFCPLFCPTRQDIILPKNVMVGKLTEDSFDIAPETTSSWSGLISRAAQIVWNGPLGKFEDPKNDQSAKIAQLVFYSAAESIVGGGDTIALLSQLDLLDQFSFVSVGGGAMLKFLADGTLPTIEALE